MSAPIPSLSWLADPVWDRDKHRMYRKIAAFAVATSAVVAVCILWYAATRNPASAILLLAPLVVVLCAAWKHRTWLLQRWAHRHLPRMAMEQRIYILLDQHKDMWNAHSVHTGGAPCVAQWRWKREGLWLEQCSVFAPDPAQQHPRRRLPLGHGQALVAHRVGPFGLANLLFAQNHATHRGLLVLEWTTAHSRLALLYAVGIKANGSKAIGGPTVGGTADGTGAGYATIPNADTPNGGHLPLGCHPLTSVPTGRGG